MPTNSIILRPEEVRTAREPVWVIDYTSVKREGAGQ